MQFSQTEIVLIKVIESLKLEDSSKSPASVGDVVDGLLILSEAQVQNFKERMKDSLSSAK